MCTWNISNASAGTKDFGTNPSERATDNGSLSTKLLDISAVQTKIAVLCLRRWWRSNWLRETNAVLTFDFGQQDRSQQWKCWRQVLQIHRTAQQKDPWRCCVSCSLKLHEGHSGVGFMTKLDGKLYFLLRLQGQSKVATKWNCEKTSTKIRRWSLCWGNYGLVIAILSCRILVCGQAWKRIGLALVTQYWV